MKKQAKRGEAKDRVAKVNKSSCLLSNLSKEAFWTLTSLLIVRILTTCGWRDRKRDSVSNWCKLKQSSRLCKEAHRWGSFGRGERTNSDVEWSIGGCLTVIGELQGENGESSESVKSQRNQESENRAKKSKKLTLRWLRSPLKITQSDSAKWMNRSLEREERNRRWGERK